MKRYTLICLTWILTAFMSGCSKKEIAFEFPSPQILSDSGEIDFETTQEPGKTVAANFTLQAASGLKTLTVRRGNEQVTTLTYTNDERSAPYHFEFSVPEDASSGTSYAFTLALTDQSDRTVEFPILIKVDATYLIENELVNGQAVRVISGKINGDFHFEKQHTYVINGALSVEDNGKLTIDAGSTVYFRASSDQQLNARLVIPRGSSLQAAGTPSEPIVFTSEKVLRGETPTYEDWGGIFIYGRAPGNRGTNVIEDGFAYGGAAPSESSGTLRFLRIEYAGRGNFHALNLFGVGSGTTVDHIQVFQCRNNAFRVRGGRVNLRYIAAVDHGGYGLWADEGWQGKGQFWLFQTNIPATLVPVNFWNQARSLEIRNHDSFFDTEPRTTFQIANVTLIGNGTQLEDGTRRGARIRRGALGQLRNMIVAYFPNDGVRVEDLSATALGSTMILDNVRAFGSGENYAQEAATFFFNSGQYDVTEEPVNGITMDNYTASVASAFNPQSLDPWFMATNYIGAVQGPSNDWTRNGQWFKNRDGSIRE